MRDEDDDEKSLIKFKKYETNEKLEQDENFLERKLFSVNTKDMACHWHEAKVCSLCAEEKMILCRQETFCCQCSFHTKCEIVWR